MRWNDTDAVTPLRSTALQLRSAGRVLRARGLSLRGPSRLSTNGWSSCSEAPRSGTTFCASDRIVPGFRRPRRSPGSQGGHPRARTGRARGSRGTDPSHASADPAPRARRRSEGRRAPETAFVAEAAQRAFPQAQLVHIVRDGRDVVCSLLERGWLRARGGGADDAGPGVRGPPAVLGRARSRYRVRGNERRQARGVGLAALCRGGPVGGLDDRVHFESLTADPAGTAAVGCQAPRRSRGSRCRRLSSPLTRRLSAAFGGISTRLSSLRSRARRKASFAASDTCSRVSVISYPFLRRMERKPQSGAARAHRRRDPCLISARSPTSLQRR